VQRLLAQNGGKAGAAGDTLKKLHILFRFAIDLGWCHSDPTHAIPRPAGSTRRAWSAEEVDAFETRWPIGTRQRLAFELLRGTGLRGHQIVGLTASDLARLPIAPALPLARRAATAGSSTSGHYALETTYGRPFSAAGFGKVMAHAISAAGLPSHCVSDGLRWSRTRAGPTR
jgi:hypothetical protein